MKMGKIPSSSIHQQTPDVDDHESDECDSGKSAPIVENEIVIFNTTPDTEVDGEGGINYTAKRNYFWGWFMIRDVKILLK